MSYIVFLKLLQFAAMFIIRTSHIMLKQYIKEVYSIITVLVLLICNMHLRIVYSNVETGVIKSETRLTD